MKPSFKLIVLIAFMSLSPVAGKALETSPLLGVNEESKTLILQISSGSKVTSLKLFDHTDTIIFFETITKQNVQRKELDMKRFADGTYTFETDDTLRKMIYTITKNKKELKITNKEEIVKPLVKLKDEKLSVLYLNKGNKNVSIKLFDARNRELSSEITVETLIQKTYNLKQTVRGKYTIVISGSMGSYQHEVNFR